MKLKDSLILKIVLSVLFFTQICSAQIDSNRQKEINFTANKFRYMLEIADQYHIDSLKLESITDAAYKTLLSSLDPQSIYYPKPDFQKLQDANRGDAEGIGIDIVPLSDTLTVIKVIEDSPADSAGLLPGDKLLFIDGKSVIGFGRSSGDSLIRGERNTKVSLIVKRQYGSSLLNEFNINRSEYNLPSITAHFMLDNSKTGYMLISRFSSKTDKEITEALSDLTKQGMKELVIDLRGNLGGVVEATLTSIGNFFDKNTEILKVKGKNKTIDTVIYTQQPGKYQDLKLLILVDRNSASASEIFAGVVQDYDRGIIVGEDTYAKGTVQKIWKMTDGTGFRITIAEYETPSGRRIQKPIDSTSFVTLDPALELNSTKEEREKIMQALKLSGGRNRLQTALTKNGRFLIAKGGVSPDIYAANDTINVLTRVLTQKGIFLEFIYDFLYAQKERILSTYKNDFKKFNREFNLEDYFLDEFKKFSFRKNLWNDVYYAQDKEYFRLYLKALIAYTLWDENGYRLVMMKRDKVLAAALNSLSNYNSILKLYQ